MAERSMNWMEVVRPYRDQDLPRQLAEPMPAIHLPGCSRVLSHLRKETTSSPHPRFANLLSTTDAAMRPNVAVTVMAEPMPPAQLSPPTLAPGSRR